MALLGFDIGFTRPAMCIAICALCLRILFNYVLIYGKFGLPEMGGVGCSLANGIFNWLQVLMTILVVLRKLFYITGWRCILTVWVGGRIKPLLIIGLPIAASVFSFRSVISLLISKIAIV